MRKNRLSWAMQCAEATDVKFVEQEGWYFMVYWQNSNHPNFISSKVKTNRGCVRNAIKYLETGKFSLYGNAEK